MDLLISLLSPLIIIIMYGLPLLFCCILLALIMLLFPQGRAYFKKLHEERMKNK